MPALDALLVRRTVADGLLTEGWRGFARAFLRNGIGAARLYHGGGTPDWMDGTERALTKGVGGIVRMAETFYVTPAMSAVVDARADAWADDDTYHPDDLPSPAGFVYVPAAIRDIGSDGHDIAVQVAAWHRVGDRLRLAFFYNKRTATMPEGVAPGTFERVPDYLLIQMYDLKADEGSIPLALRPSHPLPEVMREELNIALYDDEYLVQGSPRVLEWMKATGATAALVPDRLVVWLFSCLRLMREELPAVERIGTPTNLRRGLVQRKLRNLHVTVIEHRRRAPGANQGGTHEYSHRFLRRGHSRRVWYRDPETGLMAQRTVWIKPTVVLAHREDLPLLLRDHVNALTR